MRLRLLGILGWILALLLIGVGCLLGWQLDRRMAIEAGLRENIGGLSIHRGLDPAPSPNVIILGDSRAAGLRQAEFPGWSVINLGVPGQTTAEVLARSGRDLVLLEPDALALITGVNDLKTGSSDESVSRTGAAMNDIVSIASKLGIPTLVIETWPHAAVDLRSFMLPADLSERCIDLTNLMKTRPEDPNVRFVEIDGLVGEDGLVDPNWQETPFISTMMETSL